MKKQNKNKVSKVKDNSVIVENLDKIGEIPYYYGFNPEKCNPIDKNDQALARELIENDEFIDVGDHGTKIPLYVESKISILRHYEKENMMVLPQPVYIYVKDAMKIGRKSNTHYCDLHIIGSSGSITEATLIQTAKVMLEEEGYKNITVEINSMGDKDSLAKFLRELSQYYRKHINDLTADDRQIMKDDPFKLLFSGSKSAEKINEGAPRFVDYLNETNRKHLEEILEYLETLGIPYIINNKLVGNHLHPTETIFTLVQEIKEGEKRNDRVLAVGMRYSGIAKRMGMKKDICATSLSLLIPSQNASLRKDVKKIKKPVASFVQLGIESKLLSLSIIELLRQANIPLKLSLAKDRLGAQVSSIEKFHTPYSIVMGKKEAQEKTVIVRHQETYAQEVVLVNELADYMKRMEKRIK